MGVRDEIRDFLLARRARVSPGQAGLPVHGERRVAGLRREEVAQLAGISVEYYIRLERGNARGFSDDVLTAVAAALRLDGAEREHLFDLVHAANARARRGPDPVDGALPAGVQRLLDAMVSAPDWADLAHDAVAMLRRAPAGRRAGELIQELAGGSEPFRALWAAYDVRTRRTGLKRFHHPLAGPITVEFEALALPAHPGLRIAAGNAEPGSPSAAALKTLTKEGQT
jgi:transcriptional regulator with XRE-family HTH domain